MSADGEEETEVLHHDDPEQPADKGDKEEEEEHVRGRGHRVGRIEGWREGGMLIGFSSLHDQHGGGGGSTNPHAYVQIRDC